MSAPEERIEPGPGQESVWDYPKQPRLEPVERPVRVVFAGTEVVRSERAVRCLEQGSPPTYYVPPEDVRTGFLRPTEHRTHCPWKGDAAYSDIVVGEKVAEGVAWTYPEPTEDFDDLGGWYAFYADPLECFVGEERVRPQGGYYAGWATSDVVGPFKGA